MRVDPLTRRQQPKRPLALRVKRPIILKLHQAPADEPVRGRDILTLHKKK